MKLKISVLLTLLITTITLSAQIENEIRSYVDSSEIIIKNGRKLLSKSIADENLSKANEVYSYLVAKNNGKGFLVFSFDEELCLNLMFKNYHTFTDITLNYGTIYSKYLNNRDDNMYPVIQEYLVKKEKEISASIAQSELTDEDKDIMYIFLYLVVTEKADNIYYSQLNEFQKKFPETRYTFFINYYLPKEKTKASFAYGFGASSIFPTHELSKKFYNHTNFNVSCDFNIGKIYTSLYFQGGVLKVKSPFSVTDHIGTVYFEKDEPFSYFDAGILVGYILVRNEHFHLAPYGGIMGTNLTTNMYEDPEFEELEIDIINSFTAGIGLKTEIKLFEYQLENFYGNGYTQNSFVSLKFEGGYNVITNSAFDNFDGDVAYIRASLLWGFGSF